MPTAKEHLRRVIERLPDNCTLEDVQKELYVIQVIESRIEAAERGEVISHEEMRRRVQSWSLLPPSSRDRNP